MTMTASGQDGRPLVDPGNHLLGITANWIDAGTYLDERNVVTGVVTIRTPDVTLTLQWADAAIPDSWGHILLGLAAQMRGVPADMGPGAEHATAKRKLIVPGRAAIVPVTMYPAPGT